MTSETVSALSTVDEKTDWDENSGSLLYSIEIIIVFTADGAAEEIIRTCAGNPSSPIRRIMRKETKGLTINRKKFERYTRKLLSLKLVIASWIPRVMSDR